jgi:hypothetical protein
MEVEGSEMGVWRRGNAGRERHEGKGGKRTKNKTEEEEKRRGGINFPEGEETDWIEPGEREGDERVQKRGSLRTEHCFVVVRAGSGRLG